MITLLLFKKKDCVACDIMSNMLTSLAAKYIGKNICFIQEPVDTSDKYFENFFKFDSYPALVVSFEDSQLIRDFVRYAYCARKKPKDFRVFQSTIPINNITDIIDAYLAEK